jgi:ribosomal protein L30/L7E
VEVADTPQNRGMIGAASHLLKVQPPAEGGKE